MASLGPADGGTAIRVFADLSLRPDSAAEAKTSLGSGSRVDGRWSPGPAEIQKLRTNQLALPAALHRCTAQPSAVARQGRAGMAVHVSRANACQCQLGRQLPLSSLLIRRTPDSRPDLLVVVLLVDPLPASAGPYHMGIQMPLSFSNLSSGMPESIHRSRPLFLFDSSVTMYIILY